MATLNLNQFSELRRAIAIREPLESMITAITTQRGTDAAVAKFLRAVDAFEGSGSLRETITTIEADIDPDRDDRLQRERDEYARDTEITYLAGQTGGRQWQAPA